MAPTATQSPLRTQLKEWGTSRAVRIPKWLCEELGVSVGSTLVVEYGSDSEGSYLLLRPADARHRSYGDAPYLNMDDLFAGYDGDTPSEGDWGDDVGAEVVA